MRTIGNIERFLVLGIVVVIGAILTVAITGARDLDAERERQVAAKTPANAATTKGGANKSQKPPKPTKTPANANGLSNAPEVAGGKPVDPALDPAIQEAMKKREEALRGKSEPVALGLTGEVAPALEPVDGPIKAPVGVEPNEVTLRKTEELSRDPGLTPPAPAPIADVKERDYYYEVRKGDTLERIARSLYGDGQIWKEILAANPTIADAQRIKIGDKLKLPRAPTVADAAIVSNKPGDPGLAPPAEASGSAKSGGAYRRITDHESYQVQKGDTLMSIAAANYGTKAAWQIILAANSDKLADKDRLKTGMTLKLPSN